MIEVLSSLLLGLCLKSPELLSFKLFGLPFGLELHEELRRCLICLGAGTCCYFAEESLEALVLKLVGMMPKPRKIE